MFASDETPIDRYYGGFGTTVALAGSRGAVPTSVVAWSQAFRCVRNSTTASTYFPLTSLLYFYISRMLFLDIR